MKKQLRLTLLSLVTANLIACSTIDKVSRTASHSAVPEKPEKVTLDVVAPSPNGLSLEKIMADPQWIGRLPENGYWSDDGSKVFFSRKKQGQQVRELWSVIDSPELQPNTVPLSALHSVSYRKRVINQPQTHSAWVFEGNIFVKSMDTGLIYQLTRDEQTPVDLTFLSDGRLSYRIHNNIYAIEINSGRSFLLASWKFADKPEPVLKAKDYIEQEQHKLIQVVAKKREQRLEKHNYQQQLLAQNSTLTRQGFYLPKKHRTVDAKVSPNGKWLLLSVQKDTPWRDESDIMPDYIGEDGRIKSAKVRKRVADTKAQNQTLWLLNLDSGTKHKISYNTLPGYNEDVLAEVKKENARAKGETYEANRLPRSIGLLSDWYWDQSAIQWNDKGDTAAIMLEAWDNKDRWLVTLNTNEKSLTTQHRLQDKAWINYRYNGFGWLNNQDSLYYLSEESGYAHLYLKPLDGEARALTSGASVTSAITLTKDNSHFYFKANRTHPGIYEIFRVSIQSGEIEQLTFLNGMTDYQLSPDENKLLLTHSKLALPPELYSQVIGQPKTNKRLTFTVSETFLSESWVEPQIVPVPSSHGDKPVYARLYLPEGYQHGEKRKAVFFSHGAGYLQNVHMGWSTYFREFMFHSYLVQQGYVVMDMDYRASAGYGRDWRTAIYRHMGKAELEDLQDGIDWVVEHANVDRSKIGHYGGSYGGFITFMALFTKPDMFQAGAALRPVSDWAHYNHGYTSNILNTPDIDPIAFERSSPIYFAEGLNKPLLINAPMVDSNVFFLDVVRLVQRLIELEKEDFETAIYPVEGHGFVQPSSWLDEYRRIYKLFDQHL